MPEVVEDGLTLEDNARLKAVALCEATGLPAVADDTGLEVDALGGAPGVWSARYAGEDATYDDNVQKLLRELRDVPAEQRTARFSTVALVRWPDGREVAAIGKVEGDIVKEARGSEGFGYDPVFRPAEGDGRTFAEMTPAALGADRAPDRKRAAVSRADQGGRDSGDPRRGLRPVSARILDGVAMGRAIREEVAVETARLRTLGVTPGLAVVLVGEDPASQVYVRNKAAACARWASGPPWIACPRRPPRRTWTPSSTG